MTWSDGGGDGGGYRCLETKSAREEGDRNTELSGLGCREGKGPKGPGRPGGMIVVGVSMDDRELGYPVE